MLKKIHLFQLAALAVILVVALVVIKVSFPEAGSSPSGCPDL